MKDALKRAKGSGWTYNGVSYASLETLCEVNGADYQRTRRLIASRGYSLEDALNTNRYERAAPSKEDLALRAIFAVPTDTGDKYAAILQIAKLCAAYLRENPRG